jgi:G3E family GTPase
MNAEAAITRCQRCEIDLSQILNTGIYSAGMRPAGAEAEAGAGSGGGRQQQAAAAGAAAAGGDQQQEQQAEAQPQQEQQQCGDPQCGEPGHQHEHHQHQHHDDASSGGQHDGRVATVTLSLPGRPLDLPRLRHWLDTLLWEQTAEAVDLFRIKGLLHVAGSGRKHVLQAVHELYDIVEGPAWREGEPRGSKLVFIGRRLRREALLRDLQACLAEQPL